MKNLIAGVARGRAAGEGGRQNHRYYLGLGSAAAATATPQIFAYRECIISPARQRSRLPELAWCAAWDAPPVALRRQRQIADNAPDPSYPRQTPRSAKPTRGVHHEPCQYIRGQGAMASGVVDQTARRFSAEDLPLFRSATTSNSSFCPSFSPCNPARSTALICTNTSLLPSSG